MKTYFIQAVDSGHIKIGRSENPEGRMKDIQTSNHENLKLLAVADNDIEAELHEKFSRSRIRGEWFTPSKDLLEYIDSLPEEFIRNYDPSLEKQLIEAKEKYTSALDKWRNSPSKKLNETFEEYKICLGRMAIAEQKFEKGRKCSEGR